MRKAFILLASITTVIVACSDSESSGSAKKDSAAAKSTAPPDSSTAQKGLALVAKYTCFGCHQVSQKIIGPSYSEVAAKYPSNPAVIDSLSQKIIKGGSGNWGTVPMQPNPQVSVEEAKIMVEYILSLKQ